MLRHVFRLALSGIAGEAARGIPAHLLDQLGWTAFFYRRRLFARPAFECEELIQRGDSLGQAAGRRKFDRYEKMFAGEKVSGKLEIVLDSVEELLYGTSLASAETRYQRVSMLPPALARKRTSRWAKIGARSVLNEGSRNGSFNFSRYFLIRTSISDAKLSHECHGTRLADWVGLDL